MKSPKKLWNWQFFTIFVPYWTLNCYVIIEYTANLIKPSYSSLKTVLNRVPALVPKFKIDQNMLFLSLTSLTKNTSRTVFENSEHSFYSEPYGIVEHLLINSVYTHCMAKPSMAKFRYLRLWDFGVKWICCFPIAYSWVLLITKKRHVFTTNLSVLSVLKFNLISLSDNRAWRWGGCCSTLNNI